MNQTQPFFAAIWGLTLALCFSGAAMAEPLYLGEEEYNTDDRSVMAAIIEHCVSLQVEAEPAKVAGTQRESEGEGEERRQEADPGQAEAFAGSPGISTDGLASGDGKGEAPDLSDVSTEDCAAAGINY